MTKIAELKDRGSVVAWSPLSEYADVLALGTKVGSSFLRCVPSFVYFLVVASNQLESFFLIPPPGIIIFTTT